MDALIAIIAVVVLLTLGPPLIIGLQGWLRDRARWKVIERYREQNAGVLLVNTRRSPAADAAKLPELVSASVVRCLDSTRYAIGSLKQIIGGEMKILTGNLTLARDEATERLRENARARGFDAVLNVRYETSLVMPQAVEIVAYGTAILRK
ncbi:MAG: heavy metal-binding domain-containing protein [bacterium]